MTDDYAANLGAIFKTAREGKDMTQEDLARAARLSVFVVGKLERGQTAKPNTFEVFAMCHALGLDMAEVVGKAQRGGAA